MNLAKYLILGVAILCLLFAGYQTYRSTALIINGIPATGIVADYHVREWEDGEITYSPIIFFNTVDGVKVRCAPGIGMVKSEPLYEVGTNLKILYPPNNPSNAKIGTFYELWFVALFFWGIGLTGSFIAMNVKT